jgi:hypothetical protein
MDMEQIAKWIFGAFVIIAVLMGLIVGYMAYNATLHWYDSNVQNINGWITLTLLILGIIVGLTSITVKEVEPFLIAAVALIVAASSISSNVWSPLAQIHELLYYWATGILSYIVAFVAPAAVLIAIKSVFVMERGK